LIWFVVNYVISNTKHFLRSAVMSEHFSNKEIGEKYKAVISSAKCPNCNGEAVSVAVKSLKLPWMVRCFSCGYSDVIMWIEKQVMEALKNVKVFNQIWKDGESIEIILK
jgi:transcription elongation factor Elf1